MNEHLLNFKNYLLVELGLSNNTIKSYVLDCELFINFLNNEGINFIDASKNDLRNFIITRLNHVTYRKSKESNLSVRRRVSSIKKFYHYLFLKNVIKFDPMINMKMPKIRRKDIDVLSEQDVNLLIEGTLKRNDDLALRDLALIYLLYSSGLRCSELINVKLADMNLDKREIRVIGKGNKERVVIFSKMTQQILSSYIDSSRKKLLAKWEKENDFLFLNSKGDQLTSRGLEFILDSVVKKANITLGIKLHPHAFRHSFATRLLRNGADISFVQELLGHESISTTEKYIHLNIDDLREAYYKCFKNTKKND